MITVNQNQEKTILMLFIMVDMLFIALLESLFAKNSWSSPIICLFLFMAKGCYMFVWRH